MKSKQKTVMYVRANGIYSDSRATKEILSLAKHGYNIIIVGWDREGGAIKKCQDVFKNVARNIKYKFFNHQVKDHVGWKGIFKLYGWLRFVAKVYKANLKDIGIVHACNLDTCLFCYKQFKKHHVKFVYDIYDYYSDVHVIPSFLLNKVENKEIDMINNADFTIICTEERKEQISKSNPNKIVVIHNSPDVEFIQNETKFDYFYCGTFCIRRLIQEIFDKYPQNSDLKFGYAGYGIYKNQAIELDREFENFTYLGQIKYSECLINESQSICLSSVLEPTIRNHRLCAPNKFYEALALGKPIIVCRGTGIDKIVESENIGIVIDYDVNQFYSAVRELKNNPRYCKEMGARARKLYEEKYSWEIMENILLKAYSDIF